MALTDVNFQSGEGQDFLVELPNASYSGELLDIATESSSTQYPVLEVPLVSGSDIFIMSE